MEKLIEMILTYLPKIALGILVFFLGNWLIKLTLILLKGKISTKVEATAIPFLLSVVNFFLQAALWIAILQLFSVNITPFLVIFSAAGLAIAFILQNSLSNVANGFLLLIFKPFKIGDRLTLGEITGNVEAIEFQTTTLRTIDNKKIFIPNNAILNNPIVNHSSNGLIRLEMKFNVSPSEEVEKIRVLIKKVAIRSPYSLKEAEIWVNSFNGDSQCLDVWLWCTPDNYWDTYYFMAEQVKRQFTREHIELPIEDVQADYLINISTK